MNTAVLRVAGGLALLAAYTTGVNNGYDLGADSMQCVTYSMLTPDVVQDATIARDACRDAKTRWTNGFTMRVRITWLNATGQGIPAKYIKVRKP